MTGHIWFIDRVQVHLVYSSFSLKCLYQEGIQWLLKGAVFIIKMILLREMLENISEMYKLGC